ncbi:MAG TPA: HsdR family type I site-specific deoxyribonuclease [Kiritimatiellia bacterium]|nr:HsdR family type I site-specific deoxyribonuclease [Kiritimatiellia bacterium]
MTLNESIVEDAALEWFGDLGYATGHGPQLAPGEASSERNGFGDVVLVGRLREAIGRLNPDVPGEAREEALRKVLRLATPSLVQTNRAFHKLLRDGVDVEYARPDGSIKHDKAWLIDFTDVLANDWFVVNQFTVIEGQHNRRPDLIVFVNGLPLGLIELKNAADEDTTIWDAYAQIRTYKAEISSMLQYNAVLVISDGLQARIGSLTANQEWFKVWREPDGSPPPSPQPSPRGRGSEHYRGGLDFAGMTDKARALRLNQTPAEDALWELLRDRQLMGAKFRRQHQFGEYICDFFCHEAKLVVECDGEPHSEAARSKHDGKRDAYLRSQGLTVVRFANERVLNDTDAVLQEIGSHLPSSTGRRAGDEGQQRPKATLELQTLIYGVFERERFLKLLLHFIAFEENPDSGEVHKIIAGYHQFHAVTIAVQETLRAADLAVGEPVRDPMGASWARAMHGGKPGDRRAGVVWHTQGSGKSLSMLFYAARVIRHPAMRNPTLVVLTDRNDLDDQLFGQFQRCHDMLGQTPVQAESREQLRDLLSVASGGVVFTTIQKFLAEKGGRNDALSARRNIVVIADEAHRSQYDLIDGLARDMRDALPHASFIGFTGTPIEKTDANTRAVFGDYISIYDIQRAVADKATVPIYYESRISKLSLNAAELPKLDAEFEAITEGEELTRKEKLKTKWAALEALVGDPKRIALIAADLVAHFEKRLEAMDGKAMVVCMSRRICVDLYDALIKLRPGWEEETLKVVMTGSAEDGPDWQPHIRSKDKRRALANRFKDAKDPFKIVIVRDMWLTGFDAPCLHTMYADKPMQGHGLMQAIARVNRVFRDKPGGLVVDYLGLADQLKRALAVYTESGGQGDPTYDTRQAIAVMLEKHGIACDIMHGFDWRNWTTGKPAERLALLPAGQEHILAQDDGKKRWVQVVTELSRAFALCAASDEATEIRDDVSFFQALQAALNKQSAGSTKTPEQIDAAIRQLASKAITTEGEVIDVFTAAGLPKPDISILSDQFLAEVRGLKHKNVAAELLEKLLKDELKVRSKRNLVQSQVFSEKLKKTLNAYHNRAISTMQVIEELIKLAKDLDTATKRGEDLGLTDDEVAFYDALAANESAVVAMGDAKLRVIAAELITQVRKSVTIDWTLRESARAKIKVMVKRILNKYGYPPDLQEEAVKTVLMQAELLCAEWAVA